MLPLLSDAVVCKAYQPSIDIQIDMIISTRDWSVLEVFFFKLLLFILA